MFRRFLTVFLALVLVLAALPGTVVGADPARGADASAASTGHYYYEQLGPLSQAMYDAILASGLATGPSHTTAVADLSGIPAAERTVTSEFRFTRSAQGPTYWDTKDSRLVYNAYIEPALAALNFDHPEMSWLDGTRAAWGWTTNFVPQSEETQSFVLKTISVAMGEDGYRQATTDCSAANGSDRFDCADTRDLSAIEAAIQSAISDIGSAAAAARGADRVRAVHNWLCEHVRYADKAGERFRNNWRGYQTSFGALVQGVTVCAGYSKAFKLLCDACDIPCVLVEGTSMGEQHMWNYVQVDGKWYGVDCTWDDADEDTDYTYEYFLKGSKDFGDHQEGCAWDNLTFSYPKVSLTGYTAPAFDAGETKHFQFRVADGADGTFVAELAGALEACHDRFASHFGRTLDTVADVRIYPDVPTMESDGFATDSGAQRVVCRKDTDAIGILAPRSARSAAETESIEVEAARAYGSIALKELGINEKNCRWLTQGIRDYEDGAAIDADVIRADVARGTVPRLDELQGGFWSMDHPDEYFEAAVGFIIETYGFGTLLRTLYGQPLAEAAGQSMSVMKNAWMEYVSREFLLRPTLRADAPFAIETTADGDLLTGVQAGTTMREILSSFSAPDGTSVSSAHGIGRAATGHEIVIEDAAGDNSSVIVVVAGDVLGTGKIGLTQLVAVSASYAGNRKLTGPYLAAADWSRTGTINLTDVVRQAELLQSESSN